MRQTDRRKIRVNGTDEKGLGGWEEEMSQSISESLSLQPAGHPD